MTRKVRWVINDTDGDRNRGGFDVLVQLPDLTWTCVAETRDPTVRDAIMGAVAATVHVFGIEWRDSE